MRSPASRLQGFRRDGRAIAAVEFALLLPLLLLIILGGFQIAAYADSLKRIERIPAAVGQMLTQAPPPERSGSIAQLGAGEIDIVISAASVLFPYALQQAARRGVLWSDVISINAASVVFTPTGAICSDPADLTRCFTASLAWTTGRRGPHRACGAPLQPVDNDAPPAPGRLPRSLFGPGSVIVVDVVFTYVPVFGSSFVPPVRIARSAYLQPRYASQITVNPTTNDGSILVCSGS
ncbi:TadE/TadG family type IV pilus assembly protein [Methylobacterium sp. WSM2598]|uniref:TadE/TadG family type IV pilus assembly protein n=1 Tax=Methylobacterium sp. WSM2598 TaxID=398261 RepID=UPI00037012E6|nr:TadE/TadG family type IV pilus assembly protein [Methylobacterium sp. WSM2598]